MMCNHHSDCHVDEYCNVLDYFPYQSVCAQYIKNGDVCDDEYMCPVNNFCWYATPDDVKVGRRTCLEKYTMEIDDTFGWKAVNTTDSLSPNLVDFTFNGKYCKTGLAFNSNMYEATCVNVIKVMQGTDELRAPYACDPTDPRILCQLNFSPSSMNDYSKKGKRGYVETPCKCSMTNTTLNEGFCGSVIGTDKYTNHIRSLKNVIDNSKCHTLDKENLQAQRDDCGVG